MKIAIKCHTTRSFVQHSKQPAPPGERSILGQSHNFVPLLGLSDKRLDLLHIKVIKSKLSEKGAVHLDGLICRTLFKHNHVVVACDNVIGRLIESAHKRSLIPRFVNHALVQSE